MESSQVAPGVVSGGAPAESTEVGEEMHLQFASEESTPAARETPQSITPDQVHAAIADKVRAESQSLARPTQVEDLGTLFPDLAPEQIVNHLAEMVKVEQYQDVKVMTSRSGAAYLYSDTFISPADAEKTILAEEVCAEIASKVREDSRVFVQLTPVASLAEALPELQPGQVEEYVSKMAGDERYQDIRRLIGPTGIAYLHSETHLTGAFAALLARVEASAPCAIIAETVREESRVYPRPTKVALFCAPVFKIAAGQMEMLLEGTLRRPEYKDLHKIIATTGAIYLYSDLYMDPRQAETWVQWEEVGRFENP